jgi:hypothetical protein
MNTIAQAQSVKLSRYHNKSPHHKLALSTRQCLRISTWYYSWALTLTLEQPAHYMHSQLPSAVERRSAYRSTKKCHNGQRAPLRRPPIRRSCASLSHTVNSCTCSTLHARNFPLYRRMKLSYPSLSGYLALARATHLRSTSLLSA